MRIGLTRVGAVTTAVVGLVLPWSTSSAAAGTARRCSGADARVQRNVNYLDEPVSDLQRLDIYGYNGEECDPVPVVVYVHGGGWRKGDKRQVGDKADFFNDLGYVFVSVNYRLSDPPDDPDRPMFPDHPADVGAAVAWLEDNVADFGGDGEHLMLIGHSAGGHLVELVGLDPTYVEDAGGEIDAVQCVVGNDGAGHDIVANATGGAPRTRRIYVNAFGNDEAVQREASPIEHVGDRENPPAVLLITRGLPGRVASAQAFGDTLEEAGSPVRVVNANPYTHGDVNRRLGEQGEQVVTPPVEDFTRDCLG